MEEAKVLEVPQGEKRRRTRRRGQAGSVMKRGSAWTIIYRVNGKQKWEGGFRTKDEAQTRLGTVLKSIRDNRYVEPKDISFGDFCQDWMSKSKGILKPKTWFSYQSALNNWILPNFKDWLVGEINRSAVKDFVDRLIVNRELSRKFIKNVVILLHRLFEEAMERELIAANPAHHIRLPRPEGDSVNEATNGDVVVPTTSEVALTFAELPPTYQALLATSSITGLRRAELLGLQWSDIDWINLTISVRRTLQRIKKSFLDDAAFRGVERIGNTGLAIVAPKSMKARRLLEMPPKLAMLLTALRAQRVETECPFVFQNDLGGPLDPDAIYDVLHTAQNKAGVRRFGLHGLRHLFASLLVASGADVKFAQDRLGHASASTTLDIYSHAITKRGREFAAKVEEAFPFVSLSLAKTSPVVPQSELVN